MQPRKCEYCGVIQHLSTDKCINCGGQLNKLKIHQQYLTTKKKLIFALLLMILLAISPLAYYQHIENTSDAILNKLQPDRVEPNLIPSAVNPFMTKAKFSQVLVEISGIKVLITEQFYNSGSFPTSLSGLGFNEATLNTGKLIQALQITEKGLILVHLAPDVFGNEKTLTLTPRFTMAGMNLHWDCTSNLEKYLISSECVSTAVVPEKLHTGRSEAYLEPSAVHPFRMRSNFSEVLYEVTPIKLKVAWHFQETGSYPASLSELGMNEATLDAGELIQTIHLSEKSIIQIHLSAKHFGNDKTITLTPSQKLERGGRKSIHWACISNLKEFFMNGLCHSTA